MSMVEMLAYVLNKGCNASSGPCQWLKCKFRSMSVVRMLVQVHDTV